MKKVFCDAEFTGLTQKTQLISIGFFSETKESFYAEFTDYDEKNIDIWVKENVISQLFLTDNFMNNKKIIKKDNSTYARGTSSEIAKYIIEWFHSITNDKIEFWGDCLAYDWILFCELFGGALKLPDIVYYIPFDICTLFKLKNIDPDINRENFAQLKTKSGKHNSGFDAFVIANCYEQLMKDKSEIIDADKFKW